MEFNDVKVKISKISTFFHSETMFWIAESGNVYGNGTWHSHKFLWVPPLINELPHDQVLDVKFGCDDMWICCS